MFESSTDAEGAPLPWWLDVDQIDFDDWADEDPGQSGTIAEIASRPLGPSHLTGLLNIDRSMLTANDSVTYMQQWDRAAAWMAGQQADATAATFEVLVANAQESESCGSAFATAEMTASAEAAAALKLSPRTADARIQQALDLAGPTRLLRDAMTSGRVSAAHTAAISRELDRLPSAGNPAHAAAFADQCAEVLSAVVPFAEAHTPGEAARRARMLVSAIDPTAVRKRRREINERMHGVFMRPTEPGACEIVAVMPIAHGEVVMSAINILARDERFDTANGCVTPGQRRVAAMVKLMLGDPGAIGQVTGPVGEAKLTAHFNVVVPLTTVLAGQQAGTIGGEAVPADALWEILADADPKSTLRRLVVDEAGCILDAGRTRYAISDTQRRIIQLRDGHCRFPGCTEPAHRCDIDHATAYDDDGRTDLDNLGPLCRRHHQLKTHANWRIIRSSRNGECTWRSPLGRIYEHQPPALLPTPTPARTYDCPPPF